ncbi:hypothetical protein D3C71_1595320 [compost metagenome]
MANGIGQQVGVGAGEQGVIGPDVGVCLYLQSQLQALLLRQQLEEGCGGAQPLLQGYPGRVDGPVLTVGARQEQHVFDQASHALIRWHGRLDHGAVFVGTARAGKRDLGGDQKAVDGRPQIVRKVG